MSKILVRGADFPNAAIAKTLVTSAGSAAKGYATGVDTPWENVETFCVSGEYNSSGGKTYLTSRLRVIYDKQIRRDPV